MLNGEPILGALFGARRDVVGHRPVWNEPRDAL